MTTPSYIVPFARGGRDQADLLGGKGANLAEMTRLGLPVPPGFTVTTQACRAYLAGGERFPDGLIEQLRTAVAELESATGRRLGDPEAPLLLSVRSGARFSMPGMMDTVLDLGLNAATTAGLARATGDPRFAADSHRRFIQLFGKVVLGVPGEVFETVLQEHIVEAAAGDETGLSAEDLGRVAAEFGAIVERHTGQPFPDHPWTQLELAVAAVFRSWNGRRARDYRRMEGIPDDLGTAVNVQTMVFGNLGDRSATGVAFTRNPATGEARPYGDWLPGAQGEDVVAGIRATRDLDTLGKEFPVCHTELLDAMALLERHYRDLCDIEFTIEDDRLFILQTRVGKRTAAAALRMAVEMTQEGLIDARTAVGRVTPEQLERLLHPTFAPDVAITPLVTGLAASPGAATGAVVFTADDAEERAAAGEAVILLRPETSPDDLHGMIASEGIVTSRGGLVSHAAVVARGMGKPAVCGADALRIDLAARTATVGDTIIAEGDIVSIDGSSGVVVLGAVPLVRREPDGPLGTLLDWADSFARLSVRANADTPADAAVARAFGAVGIGLARTEHMFLGDRLPAVQRMILAETEAEEHAALAELAALQVADFRGLLEQMDGLPVTVRLLDPPLHEFLPHLTELEVAEATGRLDEPGRHLLEAARTWQEVNPMLGTRGCRLGILRPALYRMQVRALMEAAVAVRREGGAPDVEIMIPLVAAVGELELVADWVREEAEKVLADVGERVSYRIGTMIETPRAVLIAGALARTAEFFSFGTNDLTQLVFGFSRDDVEGRIMPTYLERGVLPENPFASLDPEGVGRMVRAAAADGRSARGDIQLGICGEHGGDPASICLVHEMDLDYVSCSPYRVPVARLAAAQAALGVTAAAAGR
jgi:pyruvate, orthophosphate dikinase